MYTSNRERRKKLILAYPDTRRIYRTIQVLFLFLIVSTLVTFCISKWSEYKLNEQKNLLFGEWDHVYVSVDEKNLSYFENHAFIEKYGIQKIQDRIYIDDKRIVVGSCNENFFELGNLRMISGRLPLNEGEVAIEEEYLSILGVEKVGDYISDEIGTPSLAGYQVCGIVQDYSSIWNMVNPDLKLVNCFIVNSDIRISQIFSRSSRLTQEDIKINVINQYHNVEFINESILFHIMGLWFVVLFLFLVLFEKLIRICQYRKRWIDTFSFVKFIEKRNSKKIFCLFFCKAFYILMLIYLFNFLYFGRNDVVNDISSIIIGKFKLNIGNYLNIKENSFNYGIIYFANNFTKSILELTVLLLWIILINYIIVDLCISFIRNEYLKSNKWILKKYYYDDCVLFDKGFKAKILIYLIIEHIIVMIILYCFESGSSWKENCSIIISNLFLFNTTVLLINAYFIKKTIKRLENNTDWLLTNESE